MSYKVSSICMKVIFVAGFLLFFQPVFSQYNWSELDNELAAKQKLLGQDLVAMIWKDDSLVYKKKWAASTARHRHLLPAAVNG